MWSEGFPALASRVVSSALVEVVGALKVKTGQRVARGETIALVGITARSTGPHVHFELWENGGQVDPATAVSDWARTGR
jgi:murein DD-endopeptidase MepM/ murein hydrolase activator NlpD